MGIIKAVRHGIEATLDPLDGFLLRVHLPQPEPGDQLFRLGERAVDHGALVIRKFLFANRQGMMKNGTTLSLWFRLLNLERESVADLPRWIGAAWSTGSFTWFAPAAPGDCCRATLVLGKPSTAVFGAGARIGLGHSFTTRC